MSQNLTTEQIKGIVAEILEQPLKDLDDRARQNQEKIAKELSELRALKVAGLDPETKMEQAGARSGQLLRAFTRFKSGGLAGCLDFAREHGLEHAEKALGEATLTGGGVAVPAEVSRDLIELRGAKTVVRAAGAATLPMPSGNLTMTDELTGPTAAYVGESAVIAESQGTYGQIQLNAHKLAVLVPVSNELIADSSGLVDQWLRRTITKVGSRREDLAFITGDGTQNTPTGMLNLAQSAHKFNSTGVTAATIAADLAKMNRLIEEANVDMTRPGWLMSPRSRWFLMGLLDANSNYIYRDEMLRGTVLGLPFYVTTQIVNTGGGGSNESKVYLANFDDLVIGETLDMVLSIHENAAYGAAGSVTAGVSTDETVIRMLSRHDFAARQRGYEIAILQAVTWGA